MKHRLLDVRPLRVSPAYRRLWVGTSLSAVGGQIASVAVLFQVWEMTHSPVWTGAVGLARAVPLVLLGLVGGALADAVDRRSLVRWTMLAQLVAALGLAAQALLDVGSLGLLLLLVATQAGFGALGAPAQRTFPVRLLGRELVASGIALQHLSFQAAMLVGPALAGLVLGQWGLTPAYLVQAVASLAALYAVVRLPAMPPTGAPSGRGPRAVVEGMRYIRRSRVVSGLYVTDLVATLLAMPIALFPVINEERFGGDPETLGLFLSAVAVGGVLAGFASGTVTRSDRPGAVQLWAAGTWGAALAVFGLVGPLWLALAALVLAGAADTVSVISRGAAVQLATPDSHRGRVTSVEHVIGVAGPEIGNFRAGVVAGATSAAFAATSGGLACLVGIVVVAATNRELRRFRISRDIPDPDDA
ncbi:Predicted arabinose efflux permease, MFS family [Georgenia satyanarayanai]|uniref:Predicted arabinose efflux permease, MFS family n=1 Tax=Georgenia satyanarayanai TaxID=860221 RepID=A0A2Y9BV03_9MICO|nr:MFS transporter [Georgenia satyanarayanai]PYG01752.1 putative MFS family arabinose efflux permease [Georgenia satyanarayanai]SSA36552.1 Predicted arabinose efflux permease, MFS family [Georgenia satyanarayanai]